MLTIDALNAFGADTAAGLGRCLNNEAFYLRLVGMAAEDAGFDRLKAALEQGDLDAAFEAAHGLKGVLGNLSLSPLYAPISEMTELLRSRTRMDYSACLDTVLAQRDRLKALSAE